MKALIGLEDGTVLTARSFSGSGEAMGELVFNTSMTGYQELLTDPSGAGQLVTMTYPLIGNSGVNPEDMESAGIHPRALLVREYQRWPSNYRATESLADFLQRSGVLGVEGVDTRLLTRKIRIAGTMKALISTEDMDPDSVVRRARAWSGLDERDLVKQVSCVTRYCWQDDVPLPADHFAEGAGYKVVVYDYGVKYAQLRLLARKGCRVLVVPADTPAEEVLALQPDGVFLSSGPGNPAAVHNVVGNVKKLLGQVPIFGICLGHLLLGLAYGCRTYKLKAGHRGSNHPVKNLLTGRVEITSQSHGFCIDTASVPASVEATHTNLNDNSLEGMRHRELPAFSVQYHPEFASGPHDAEYLFDRFIQLMEQAS